MTEMHAKDMHPGEGSDDDINGDVCSICLSKIPEAGHVTTLCSHSFCLTCFLKHNHTVRGNQCPLCRRDIQDPNERGSRLAIEWERLRAAARIINATSVCALIEWTNSLEQFELAASQEQARSLAVLQAHPATEARRLAVQQAYDAEVAAVAERRAAQHAARARQQQQRQEASARRETRRTQDRENGIIVGAKIRVNPNGDIRGRRSLGLSDWYDNKLATITKVMIVNIDIKFDDRNDHFQARIRKNSPYFTVVTEVP